MQCCLKQIWELSRRIQANNLSHADALAFVSGSDLMQNSHDPNPNGEQSINAGKNGSLQETQQKVGGSRTEGVQAENGSQLL